MFKRIMVPLDGSEYAAWAIPLAARIARTTAAQVVLTCVFDDRIVYLPSFGPVPVSQAVVDAQYDALRAGLAEQARQPALAGVSVSTELLNGPIAATLLTAIETEQIDLVVMNSHGRGGMERWLLGSVAEHLVHHATVPLLILRATTEATPSSPATSELAWDALVGLDGSAFAEEALAPTAQVMQALNGSGRGRLRLIRVARSLSEADDLEPVLGGPEQMRAAHELALYEAAAGLDTVAQRLRTQYPTLEISETVVEHRDPAAALIDLAGQLATEPNTPERSRAVLIGIATHGRGALARWTLGSVAYRVLEGSNVPVLIVRPKAIAQQQQAAREHILGASPLRRTAPITPPQSHANHV
jgi:nucleotide-binding universal stress UspA family protein